jgi:hypothetical protein
VVVAVYFKCRRKFFFIFTISDYHNFDLAPGRFREIISCNFDAVIVSALSILIITSFALIPASFADPLSIKAS